MSAPHGGEAAKAKLWLVVLTFAWGLTWPIMRIALDEIGPWAMRALGFIVGTVALFGLLKLQGRSLFSIPRGRPWLHVAVAGFFNVVTFAMFSSFAQLAGTTSRVVIINYSMPIWGSLMAWIVLGEKLNAASRIGLLLCGAGLAVLVAPIVNAHSAPGLLLALGCAWSWGAGTLYIKWAKIPADLIIVTAWQIAMGAVVLSLCYLIFEGRPVFAPVSAKATLALIYSGVIGSSFAFFLWFKIIERLPMATASLGLLGTPMVGVVASVLLLGEHPTVTDIVGFGLILAAAVCVLLPFGRGAARTST